MDENHIDTDSSHIVSNTVNVHPTVQVVQLWQRDRATLHSFTTNVRL